MERSDKIRDLNAIEDSIERSVISDIVSDDRYSDQLHQFLEIQDLSESLKIWKKVDNTNAWDKISNHLKPSRSTFWFRIAIAASVILIMSIFSVMHFFENQILYEAEGSIKHIVLSDGSDIILEEGSVLSVYRKFNTKERNVDLAGSAYFNVAGNSKIPFIINTGEFRIRVIGTEFYIGFKENQIGIDLLEGKVSVSDKKGEVSMIESGQSYVFRYEKRIEIINPEALENRLNADIKFDNVTLNDAVAMLNDIYEREVIVIDENIKNIGTETIYTTVRNSSVREFVRFIEIVFDANVINSKGQYIIYLNEIN